MAVKKEKPLQVVGTINAYTALMAVNWPFKRQACEMLLSESRLSRHLFIRRGCGECVLRLARFGHYQPG
jgi:hypothetical protein